jgi:methanogenic corrinoid protein MtbC1
VLHETGIKPDTLRAWERRYGLPHPVRTSGGHRLYSQSDIEMIKWLMHRQDEGMRINRAIDLWKSIEDEGGNPLRAMPIPAERSVDRSGRIVYGSTLNDMRQQWISACMAFDEVGAERLLSQAFALYPVEAVCVEVLQRGISEIGELWYKGGLTVQQEHFASSLVVRKIDSLIAASPLPTRHEKILVACAPEDEHTFAPLMITLFLRQRGWDVVYLGANVPQDHLRETIISTGARLIVITASHLNSASLLYDVAINLRNERVLLGYGGSIFNRIPALSERIPGYFLGKHLENVTQVIEQIIAGFIQPVPYVPVSVEYREVLEYFLQRQALIEASVWESLHAGGNGYQFLQKASTNLSRNIEAGLRMGVLEAVEAELEWIDHLILNHNLTPSLLLDYIGYYIDAMEMHLNHRGRLVIDWMRSMQKTIFERNA